MFNGKFCKTIISDNIFSKKLIICAKNKSLYNPQENLFYLIKFYNSERKLQRRYT